MRFNSRGRPGHPDKAPSDLAWRVIGLVNLYRLLIAGSLFVASLSDPVRDLLFILRPTQMTLICAIYFFVGIGLIAMRRLSFAGLRMLALAQAFTDSVAIAWILWASGGVQGGLGTLILLPIGAMALLSSNRDAFFMAAMATVAVLVQQFGSGARRARELREGRLTMAAANPEVASMTAGPGATRVTLGSLTV